MLELRARDGSKGTGVRARERETLAHRPMPRHYLLIDSSELAVFARKGSFGAGIAFVLSQTAALDTSTASERAGFFSVLTGRHVLFEFIQPSLPLAARLSILTKRPNVVQETVLKRLVVAHVELGSAASRARETFVD